MSNFKNRLNKIKKDLTMELPRIKEEYGCDIVIQNMLQSEAFKAQRDLEKAEKNDKADLEMRKIVAKQLVDPNPRDKELQEELGVNNEHEFIDAFFYSDEIAKILEFIFNKSNSQKDKELDETKN